MSAAVLTAEGLTADDWLFLKVFLVYWTFCVLWSLDHEKNAVLFFVATVAFNLWWVVFMAVEKLFWGVTLGFLLAVLAMSLWSRQPTPEELPTGDFFGKNQTEIVLVEETD